MNKAISPTNPFWPPIVETILVRFPITSAPKSAPVPNNISAIMLIEIKPRPKSIIGLIPCYECCYFVHD